MRVARPVVLDSEQIHQLEQWSRARSLPARLVERSRIVLLAGQGNRDIEIAAQLGDSNDVDQSFRYDADQSGAKRRRALSV